MLTHACCAILCGGRGYAAIAQWGRDQPIELMHKLGYRRRPPAYGAFQGLFSRLDAAAFEAALARWVGTCWAAGTPTGCRPWPSTARCSAAAARPHAPAVHLLAAMDQATGCVLRQLPRRRQDQRAQGRPGAAQGPGPPGAGHHRRRHVLPARPVAPGRRGGRPLPLEGGRQPADAEGGDRVGLRAGVFPPTGERLRAAELDGPGRWTPTAAGSRLGAGGHDDAGGLPRLARRGPGVPGRAEVKNGGEATSEVPYVITSVPRERADAATLLGWHRGHWGIENRSHYVRDVTMGEDANRTRAARVRRCWRRCGTWRSASCGWPGRRTSPRRCDATRPGSETCSRACAS